MFLLVCAAGWLAAGPAQLGGPAYYVIVDGRSMQPTYQQGDLVLVRARSSYAVGDVVAYQPDIGQRFPVIHRIVETKGEGVYVTQGDNRAQADGWLASDANIFGAAWLHIPYGGRVIVLLRRPLTWLAVAAGLVALGLLTEARRPSARSGHRRRGRHLERHSHLPVLPALLVIFALTAHAANLAVDGGVLQSFPVAPGPAIETSATAETEPVASAVDDPADAEATPTTVTGAGDSAAIDDPVAAASP